MADYPRVTHPCAAPTTEYCYPVISVRLACLIHAASVRSEPESNSPLKNVSLNARPIPMIEIGSLQLLKLFRSPQANPRNRPEKGLLKTYRTSQFSKSSERFRSKSNSRLGDKKPESPIKSIFVRPLRTFVNSSEKFMENPRSVKTYFYIFFSRFKPCQTRKERDHNTAL